MENAGACPLVSSCCRRGFPGCCRFLPALIELGREPGGVAFSRADCMEGSLARGPGPGEFPLEGIGGIANGEDDAMVPINRKLCVNQLMVHHKL